GFSALPGERSALEEVLTIDEQEIDAEYLPDFKALKAQITAYLSETTPEKEYLFDSALWHRIQTYLGGKRKDLNGQPIYGKYELVKIL
ncbi:flavocytochrome c, partial [Enterococcus faecalis]|nr:flavocytochrome c [Enterococcus faecalis]